jgi:hypothetical protein
MAAAEAVRETDPTDIPAILGPLSAGFGVETVGPPIGA